VRGARNSARRRLTSIGVEDASAAMLAAIDERQRRLVFPALYLAAEQLSRLLPAAVYERVVAGRGRKPKPV
jgi:hypothetical protein